MMPSSDRMSLPVSDPPPQQKGGGDEQRLFKGSTMTSRGAYDAVSYMSCAGIKSKDELLYQQVTYGNSEGIKSLRNEGAGFGC